MPAYYALCCPGLEDVVSGEVGERLPEAILGERGTGWVVFTGQAPPSAVLELRSVDAVGLWLGGLEGLEPGPDGLRQIEEWAGSLDAAAALADARAMRELPALPFFRVSAHRVGTHAYTSMDWHAAAASSGDGLARAHERVRCERRAPSGREPGHGRAGTGRG